MIQYKTALAITIAIKQTSIDRLYKELGLESLSDRRWSCRPFFFHKIIQRLLPSHPQNYHNVVREETYITCSTTQNKIKPIPARTKALENSFFPNCIKESGKLNNKIKNTESISNLKATVLN